MTKAPNPTGKGFPKSPEALRDAKDKVTERRQIIKNIIEDRGWQQMKDLHLILTTEYKYFDGSPIKITRQTLYGDLDIIGRDLEIVGRERSNLLASYRKKQKEIDDLLKKNNDPHTMIQLYRLWSQYAKDYSIVLGRMGALSSADTKGGGSQKTPINIKFE